MWSKWVVQLTYVVPNTNSIFFKFVFDDPTVRMLISIKFSNMKFFSKIFIFRRCEFIRVKAVKEASPIN